MRAAAVAGTAWCEVTGYETAKIPQPIWEQRRLLRAGRYSDVYTMPQGSQHNIIVRAFN